MRILVIDDEPEVMSLVQRGLVYAGYEVDTAYDAESGLVSARDHPPDLVVLDRMLPDLDGLEVCRRLRAASPDLPVLMLTAKDAIPDRVAGLEAGADDYVVKPFAFAELLARARALIRRGRGDQRLVLSVADLTLDVPSRSVSRGGEPVELTPREFELLEYLVRHKGTLVSREMLARDVWKETDRCTPLDNVIDVHMARLRKRVDQGRPA